MRTMKETVKNDLVERNESNGRTHEPSLRETVAQLDDFKELVLVMFAERSKVELERDRRYEDRFKAQETAVAAALSAQKELTNAAFSSSEKAIVKAEDAQRDYNVRSNEFRGQLDDQAKTLMPRSEALAMFEAADKRLDEVKNRYDAELGPLKDFRSDAGGRRDQQSSDKGQSNWLVGMVISIVIAAISVATTIIIVVVKK